MIWQDLQNWGLVENLKKASSPVKKNKKIPRAIIKIFFFMIIVILKD